MAKRIFDFVLALILLLLLSIPLLFLWIISSIDTKSNGFFIQERIGRFGKKFKIIKLRTIHFISKEISKTGFILRNYKIDEWPQLFNIIIGDMSFVGPRPDVPGYYDLLQGEDKMILELKPGLTGPAAIKYRDEETLLKQQPDPLYYNDTVIFPDKVKMNLDYYYTRSFFGDVKIILNTLIKK